jgi:hypothetical protein
LGAAGITRFDDLHNNWREFWVDEVGLVDLLVDFRDVGIAADCWGLTHPRSMED